MRAGMLDVLSRAESRELSAALLAAMAAWIIHSGAVAFCRRCGPVSSAWHHTKPQDSPLFRV